MTENKEQRGDWVSKQHQRIEESWKIHAPVVALLNLVFLLATLANLAWGVQISMLVTGVLMVCMVAYLWTTGYIWDRSKYLQRRSSRLVQMTQAVAMYHQYRLAAATDTKMKAEMLKAGFGDQFDGKAIEIAEKTLHEELEWFSRYQTGNTKFVDEQEGQGQ